jgi:hypothetical protein
MKLRMWYAVHGANDASPSPAGVLNSVRPKVPGLELDFETTDGQWKDGCLRLPDVSIPVILLRRVLRGEETFLWDREGWEAGLRAWAGPMPNCEDVIQHLRKTRQTVYITPTNTTLGSTRLARVCEQLCGYFARATDGLIHVFQEGFFNPEGESLHPYCPQHRLKTS